MWTLYRQLLGSTLKCLWRGLRDLEGVVAVVSFGVLLFNKKLGQELLSWEGVNPLWCLIPLGMLLVHSWFKECHRMIEVEKRSKADERTKAETKADALSNKLKAAEADRDKALQAAKSPDRRASRIEEIDRQIRQLGEFLEELESMVSACSFERISRDEAEGGRVAYLTMCGARWTHRIVTGWHTPAMTISLNFVLTIPVNPQRRKH